MHMLGIHGDPVAANKPIAKAKKTGEDIGLNVYGFPGRSSKALARRNSSYSARSISAYDFAWTQPGLDKEMRVTCNASYYEDNSDSCELWVPGSPLFPSLQSSDLVTGGDVLERREFLKQLNGG